MSEMKVTLVANASQPVSEFGKLQAAATDSAKSFAQVTKAATEGAKAASGSFQDLKAKLGSARAELDRLAEGTPEFEQQAAAVKALSTQFTEAKNRIAELTAAESSLATGTAMLKEQQVASTAAAGSVSKLKEELSAAESELNKLEIGSEAFKEQALVVAKLTGSLDTAKQQIKEMIAAEAGLATGTAQLKEQQVAIVAATGSLTQLKQELSAAETELNGLAVGSDAFKEKAIVVGQLSASVDAAKQQMKELVAAEAGLMNGSNALANQAAEATAAAGSFRALKTELSENIQRLEAMAAGTEEFSAQKVKVDELKNAVERANSEMASSALAVVGSYQRLEDELRDNEAALKRMVVGSDQFEAQRKKVDQLKTSLAKAKTELTEFSNAGKLNSWGDVATSMGIATGAATLLYAALQRVATAQREIVSGASDEVVALDTLARQLQIQAGLTDPQKQEQTIKIIGQSTDAGVKADVGFGAATQLAGSGFVNAVDTGSLTTILDTIQASSFKGSPEELVSAFTETLNAYGLEKTNENLQGIAVAAQSLFKQTDFQLTELGDFAKNAAVFESANIGLQESLAAFTALREVLPAAESGTGLRNFVNILQGGAATKASKEALGLMGVTPDKVDFVGENLTDVITTINTATAQMDDAAKNVALLKVFGRENVASAKLLMANVDRVKELEKLQQNREQFNADRAVAVASLQSERNRQENQIIVDRMPIAKELADLDKNRRALDAEFQKTTETATASGIPLLGATAVAASAVLTTADGVVGGKVVKDVNDGLFEVFKSFFRTQEDLDRQAAQRDKQLLDVNQQQVELLKAVAQNVNGVPAIRNAAPRAQLPPVPRRPIAQGAK